MPPYFNLWDNVDQHRFLARFNQTPKYITMLPGMLKLEKALFKDYDNQISPITEDFTSLDPFIEPYQNWIYFIDVFRLKLLNINAQEEQVIVVTEIIQSWHDPRLEWNVTHWNDVKSFHIRLDKVWSPPMLISAASEIVEHRDQNYRMAKIFYDGTVFSHVPLKLTFSCDFDMTDFPFDTQICEIQIALPVFHSSLYDFEMKLSGDIDSCFLGNSEWDVLSVANATRKIYAWMGDEKDGGNSKYGIIKMHLKRKPMYYLYMIILPTFIINSISLAGVFLRNTSKIDRLTIALTHIMTMTFILGIVADNLPRSTNVPLLGKFIIFSLLSMMFALIASTYLKRTTKYFALKLVDSVDREEQNQMHHLILSPKIRYIILVTFQLLNFSAFIYLFYRAYTFERDFAFPYVCNHREKNMDSYHEKRQEKMWGDSG